MVYRLVYYNNMVNISNNKEKILNVALELFSDRGFEAVSVNEIVQKVGVSKPTLYYFFESKEGLFKSILKKNYNKLYNRLFKVANYVPHTDSYYEDVYPVLLNIVKEHFEYVKENRNFYLLMLSFIFAPPTSQTSIMSIEYYREHYKIIKDLFKDISKIHKNIIGKEEESATSFLAVINSEIALWLHGKEELSEERASSIVHQFMHGVFA